MSTPKLSLELQPQPKKATNLELLNEASDGMAEKQRVAMDSYMLGALSVNIDRKIWMRLLVEAADYAAKL